MNENDQLWKELHQELTQLAHARLRRYPSMTLIDTVGLIGEVYARMAPKSKLSFESHKHFLSYASKVMRSVIIDLVRELKLPGDDRGPRTVTLNTDIIESTPVENPDPIRIDEALRDLAKVEPGLVELVEMRYFGGFTQEEIADAYNLDVRTIQRRWEKARMLLVDML